jgi:hypothetical protein
MVDNIQSYKYNDYCRPTRARRDFRPPMTVSLTCDNLLQQPVNSVSAVAINNDFTAESCRLCSDRGIQHFQSRTRDSCKHPKTITAFSALFQLLFRRSTNNAECAVYVLIIQLWDDPGF